MNLIHWIYGISAAFCFAALLRFEAESNGQIGMGAAIVVGILSLIPLFNTFIGIIFLIDAADFITKPNQTDLFT